MRIYTLFCVVLNFHIGASIEIRPEFQRNILNFGYGINFKYKGMLAHSFDRFYVVTKFMLPMIGDLMFSKLDFDYTCAYMEKNMPQLLFQENICQNEEPIVIKSIPL